MNLVYTHFKISWMYSQRADHINRYIMVDFFKSLIFYSIPYTAIHSALSQRRTFQLHYDNTEHKSTTLDVKCDNTLAATEVYRALTEKHAFYSCETVRGAVTAQFVRDLKVSFCYISLYVSYWLSKVRSCFNFKRSGTLHLYVL